MNRQRLQDLLSLSYVSRWAITPMFRQQTVAEHSFRVAAIASAIAEELPDYKFHPSVVLWALLHDAPEAYTGDLPSPFKEAVGKNILYSTERQLCPWWDVRKFTTPICAQQIVHLADTIEALSWVTVHNPNAKWKFGTRAAEKLADVLRERIVNETNQCFMQGTLPPQIREAVRVVMEELCLSTPISNQGLAGVGQTGTGTSRFIDPNSGQAAPGWLCSSPKSPSKEPSK